MQRTSNFRMSGCHLLALLSAVVMLGCGSGSLTSSGSAGGGNGGGGGGSITDAQRSAAIDAVQTKFSALIGQDADADNQTMLSFIKTRSEFAASGVSDDGIVWARFTDGRLFLVGDNLDPTHPTTKRSVPQVASGAPPRQTRGTNIPAGDQVVLLNGIGPFYDDFTSDIATYFEHEQYTIAKKDASVDSLKSLSNVGVFYLLNHGGLGVQSNGQPLYAVWTTTDRSRDGATDAKYAGDLNDGSLIYFMSHYYAATDGHRVTAVHYAFTGSFVTKYMTGKLTKNSFVLINACNGTNVKSDVFKQAFLQAGASVLAGWNNQARGGDVCLTAEYLFDRLLGVNIFADGEAPNQRPFDYLSLVQEMSKRTRIADTYPYDTSVNRKNHVAAKLLFTEKAAGIDLSGGFGLLRPTIQSLQTVEQSAQGDQLPIIGTFGAKSDQGFVTMNDQEMEVVDWQPHQISCKLPVSGPSSSGNVAVTVNGHQSNIVPLTEWDAPFRYTLLDQGTLKQDFTFHVRFRADVHEFRGGPGTTPQPAGTAFLCTPDSTCDYAFSGDWTSAPTTYSWSGAGTIKTASVVPPGDSAITASGTLQGNRMSLTILAAIAKELVTHKHTVLIGGKVIDETTNDGASAQIFGADNSGNPTPLVLTIGDQYAIPAGHHEFVTNSNYGGFNNARCRGLADDHTDPCAGRGYGAQCGGTR